jgi:tRNA nucleotidyltransferase (CCA-adding enzyme)
MHMRPQPCQEPIVPAEPSAATQLWQRLNAPAWPLPLSALPAGSALVGGAVRDALLGRLAPQPDIDVVVPGGAIPLCRSLARRLGGSAVVLDQERDIARLVLQGWCFDLAAREGDCLSVDLQRRDYSINAIALPLAPGTPLLDPTGGLASLQRRELVAISEANLLSDPLRLLRGLRLASELGFSIAAETWGWIAQHRATLQAVAGERVLAELQKLACAPDGAHGLGQVLQSGLLDPWLGPGIALHEPLARLTPAGAQALGLNAAEQAWALPVARLACIADGAALERLRSSRALQKQVQLLRQHWQRLAGRAPAALQESERFALHRDLEADLPALLLLLPPGCRQAELLGRWRSADDPLCHPRPPLDGNQLQQQLGLGAGPRLGRLLIYLSQERAFARLPAKADRAQVLALARQWLEENGPAEPNATRRRD